MPASGRSTPTQCEKTPGFRGLHMLVKPNDVLNFAGAEVAAVAADTEEHAQDCMRAIRVDYELLPFYVKETDALEGNRNTVGGGRPNNIIDAGDRPRQTTSMRLRIRMSPLVTRGDYGAPVISHQCLESHGLVAEWDADQTHLTVYASTQAVPRTAERAARNTSNCLPAVSSASPTTWAAASAASSDRTSRASPRPNWRARAGRRSS